MIEGMLELTPVAAAKIEEIMLEEMQSTDVGFLRVFVQGGGCSGFQYGFILDEIKNEDDFELKYNNVRVLVDAMSAQYLQGARVDYKDELYGSQFTVNNPNASSTCGCGSSFSI